MLELYQDSRKYFVGIRKEGDFLALRWVGEGQGLSFTQGIPYSKNTRRDAEALMADLQRDLGPYIQKLADNLVRAPKTEGGE